MSCRKSGALEYLQVLDRAQDLTQPVSPGARAWARALGERRGKSESAHEYAAPNEGRATWEAVV